MNALSQALQESKTYLASTEAMASITRDPYWPKWDSPWWHMMLLFELGLAHEIPKSAVEKMVATLKTHYLPIFPIRQEEVPEGTDPHRQIACLCAVGNMYQVLFACGVDVDKELPWMREWFLRYQLPDGGLNCDERVYTKPVPKSSIVSSIACLESVLFCRNRELTADESAFLDRGARYLLRQKLFRKVSTGEVIDADWLEIRFPRFYEYDFLRGFYFLRKWQQASGFEIPDDLVDEVERLGEKQWDGNSIVLKRYNLFDKRSLNPQADGSWTRGPADEFALMRAVSYNGALCPALTRKWLEIRRQ
ncbi:MAG: hypothetical protein IPJ84_00345 [Bdellovibrionales bacterium]|nr:hypothetical protein [Bdellovibrionales bacterium]